MFVAHLVHRQDNGWYSQRTSMLLIDIPLYNPTLGAFVELTFMFEFKDDGFVVRLSCAAVACAEPCTCNFAGASTCRGFRFARRSPFDVESLHVVLACVLCNGLRSAGAGAGAGLASISVRTGRQVELEGDANVSVSERICDALCCEC